MKPTKMLCLVLSFLCWNTFISAQYQEIKYNKTVDSSIPNWAQLLYSDNPDVEKVMQAYKVFYQENTFVKNQHTQYYKHWIRNLTRDVNGLFTENTPERRRQARSNEQQYLQKTQEAAAFRDPNSTWQGIGPFDYDHDAAGRSYAPGSAHVYTMEQAKTNPNILYAGTATTGLYKSTDYGANWNLVTADMMINGIRSIEINHSNADIAYFCGAGLIYKTIDGGSTWNLTGDAVFQTLSLSVNDLVMHPTNANILYACTESGLYRTIDAGTNWIPVLLGTFQELEFNPANTNVLYVVKEVENHTEFYKSTDGGGTWTLKVSGWPMIANTSAATFKALSSGASGTDYVQFGNNPELGSGANTDFTIEMRIKTSGWSNDPSILSNKNWASGGNKGFILAGNTNSNTWKFNIGDGSNRIDLNGGTISDNEWHHIVVSYDADGDKFVYQDGSIINSSTSSISTATNTGLLLALFQDGNLNYGGMSAEINEIRVWNTALDETMLSDYACSSITNTHPNYVNLLHYWKVNEGSGTTLNDAIGTNTGTVNGVSSWTNNNTIDCVELDLVGDENQRRVEIAVSAAAPNTIYALASGSVNGGSGLVGIYKSIDAGENWTFECCGTEPGGAASVDNPNMLGYSKNGDSDGGQYYYDLAMDVSNTNADEVHIAGIQRWQSTDGGQTFVCLAKWSEPGSPAYIHADIHDVRFFENGDLWVCGDGGIYYSTDGGTTFQQRMFGIQGTDFWGFGAGFFDGEVMLGGTYHNSTLLKDNNVYSNGWLSTAKGGAGGDNYRGFVNPGKERQVYLDAGKRILSGDRTVGFTDSNLCKEPNASYITGESSRLAFDPRSYNQMYYGESTILWKTEDDGLTCIQVHDFGEKVTAVEVAWSDPSTLYVATWGSFWGTDKKVWKSTDTGVSWAEITPISSWLAWDIAVSATDVNTLWAARISQYAGSAANGQMIWKSIDGGATWINITTSILDGEFLTNIVHQKGTDGGVYIGTRRTVYYRNNTMTDWDLFNTGLPASTFSTRLIPYYFGGKLRNGTNRSAYEVNFYENSAPIAQISVDKFESYCGRDTFFFIDHSILNETGANWNWSFPGATYVSTTNARSAKVVYSNAGVYSPELTVTDANGSDTKMETNLITVYGGDCLADTIPGQVFRSNGGGYANVGRPETLDFSGTDPFTFAAWVKLNSANTTGYIFTKYDRFVAGQYQFGIENGKLITHREVSPWQATGATDLQPNQWYYLVGTFDGNQIKVYVDGVEDGSVNMTGSINSIGRDAIIGARYRSSEVNDFFDGDIDELAVWNRALSQDEIRELRHLTLDPSQDNSLVAYWQFNETAGAIFDRAGFNHTALEATATRERSTCPVGGGWSHRLSINSAGIYNFGQTGIELNVATGTNPNGELVGFRLNVPPDEVPGSPTIPNEGYWIINNYGGNTFFDPLNSITFGNTNVANTASVNPSILKLYKRASNADLATWNTSIDEADAATAGNNLDGNMTFSTNNGINGFSQFIIQKETCPTTLYVNVDPIDNDTLQASILVSSNGKEVVGSNVVFYAGNCIDLQAGFEVESGADFLADIQNCIATTNIIINDPSSKKLSEESGLEIIVSENTKKQTKSISYDLPEKGTVSVAIQSLDGKYLNRPVTNTIQPKGKQQLTFMNDKLISGLYIIMIERNGVVVARKIMTL